MTPGLIYLPDLCADCGQDAELYRWHHGLDTRSPRFLCEECLEAMRCHVGHIEDDVYGTLEDDPWPDGRVER